MPKAYVILAPGHQPDAATAQSILAFARKRLAPYKRIRRLEFADLPKTVSGKTRLIELRHLDEARHATAAEPAADPARGEHEFWEEDFPASRTPDA